MGIEFLKPSPPTRKHIYQCHLIRLTEAFYMELVKEPEDYFSLQTYDELAKRARAKAIALLKVQYPDFLEQMDDAG